MLLDLVAQCSHVLVSAALIVNLVALAEVDMAQPELARSLLS
jgi:hypothetical protein